MTVPMLEAKDFELALKLQQMLLPKVPPSQTWEIEYYFQPSAGLSGDFIDIYNFSDTFFDETEVDEHIGVLLLDASGHGISAALISAIARPIFFKAHRDFKNEVLSKSMTEANIELIEMIGETYSYMTGISLRLNNNYFSYNNAGHPLMMYYRNARKQFYFLENDSCFLGSRVIRTDLKSRRVDAHVGDVLFLYTDGLKEATNADGQEFEMGLLEPILSHPDLDLKTMCEMVVQEIAEFGVDVNNARDDITFCIVRKKA